MQFGSRSILKQHKGQQHGNTIQDKELRGLLRTKTVYVWGVICISGLFITAEETAERMLRVCCSPHDDFVFVVFFCYLDLRGSFDRRDSIRICWQKSNWGANFDSYSDIS